MNSQIYRVQNVELHQMYEAFKSKISKELDGTGFTIERSLWHGTDAGSAQLICQNEFNRSFAGKNGMYFLFCFKMLSECYGREQYLDNAVR